MKAYITLLSNENYTKGVIGLFNSLQNTNAKYPLYCALSRLVTSETEELLKQKGINCIRLTRAVYIENANNQTGSQHWNYTFDKLLIWDLVQFEKLVFLDSDMMVVQNLDALFDCKPFSAVSADCSYPGNEGWAGGLNSGLMVIEPNRNVADELCSLTNEVVADFQRRGLPVGDQDVIKRYYARWADEKELHLDEGYNIFADHLDYYIEKMGYSLDSKAERPIYVIHFVGKHKPWMRKNIKGWLLYIKQALFNPYFRTIYTQYRKLFR